LKRRVEDFGSTQISLKEAAGHSRIARLYEGIGNESFHSDEWNLLVRELVMIRQHYQAMVDHLRLDYVVLYGQYQQLLHIRDRWRGLWARLGQHDASDEDGSPVQHPVLRLYQSQNQDHDHNDNQNGQGEMKNIVSPVKSPYHESVQLRCHSMDLFI
jgi:hypothetical protein